MRFLEKKWLRDMINATGLNFQFKYEKEFEPIFNILYDKIKECDQAILEKKFQELWKTTSAEWNDEYGFRGYPSLARWLEILVEKPLTKKELEKRKKEYEEKLTAYANFIVVWVSDPNLSISFCNRYKNPSNRHLKLMIDSYCKIKEELPDERIKKMAIYLKEKLGQNKQLFFKEMRDIAKNQNQLLLIC